MKNSQIKDIMQKSVVYASPDDTLSEASKKMKEADCGCLPVGTKDKIEGVITDRDIVIRVLAEGEDPAVKKVRDYMTNDIIRCDAEETLVDAAKKMREQQVSRLFITDEDSKICGVLSFGRILRNYPDADEMCEVISFATGKREWRPQQEISRTQPDA